MLIVKTESSEVYRNLAVEEWLLGHAEGRGPILFLCVNSPCVVIGKNQNPWRECRLSLMEEAGVPLARRISGGGAVYHDEGNLNIGVIVPRAEYCEEQQYELIFNTLNRFGIKASRLLKNSLAVDGKKFSGQAFCFRGRHVLHHGTLLVNSDLGRLGRYLGAEIEAIETNAVASVPAHVTNLAPFAPGLTVEKLSGALMETFRKMYGSTGVCEYGSDKEIPEAELLPMIEKLSSADWQLRHTPRFQVTLDGQTLDVEKGRITNLAGIPLFEDFLTANGH